MAGFEVDPDAVRRAAAELQSATDELDTAVTGFAAALGGFGDPWGLDTLGTLIGGGYVAIEQLALKTLDSVIDDLDSYAERLTAMADAHAATEQDTADSFRNLNREW